MSINNTSFVFSDNKGSDLLVLNFWVEKEKLAVKEEGLEHDQAQAGLRASP